MRKLTYALSVGGIVLCLGCTQEGVESTLRHDASRPGKVGALRGLEVMTHAHARVRAVMARVDRRCELYAPATKLTLEITRTRGALKSTWKEIRWVQKGRRRMVKSAAEFQTMIGQAGTREWVLIWDDGVIYVKDGAEEFYSREATPADEPRWTSEGEGMFQVIVDAVGGWQTNSTGFALGDAPLRCGPQVGDGWLARFGSRAQVLSATLVKGESSREVRGKWVLDGGEYLNVRLVEETVATLNVKIPATQSVAPDRSFAGSSRLLKRMIGEGLVGEVR